MDRPFDIMFQSSPALSSGRYGFMIPDSNGYICFNHRPLFRAGATPDRRQADQHEHVSILARSFERALPKALWLLHAVTMFQSSPALSSGRYSGDGGSQGRVACFNPRPLFRAGATLARHLIDRAIAVSILARSFERALPEITITKSEPTEFQSSPALSSGRYCVGGCAVRQGHGFNPRPLFRAGATQRRHA